MNRDVQSLLCLARCCCMIGGPRQDTSILQGTWKRMELIEPLYALSMSLGLQEILKTASKMGN